MIKMTILTILLVLTSFVWPVSANEESKHKNVESKSKEPKKTEVDSSRFGPDKAVQAFDKEEGFKLSLKAIKTLGINFKAIEGSGPWRVSKGAIVHLKQSSGIYRRYDGWISMVLVKIVGKDNDSVLIQSADLESSDEVAITGVQFLRMTDADLNAGTVDTCAH